MSGTERFEPPVEGALYGYTYDGPFGGTGQSKDVIESVRRSGDSVVANLAGGGRLKFDPRTSGYGTYTSSNGDGSDLYSGRIVVPPSQVRHPGVSPGDTVKVRSGSNAYRVESVNQGMVLLEDGREVPVTQIGAFDEDVDDYDPFSLIPGEIEDIFGGG